MNGFFDNFILCVWFLFALAAGLVCFALPIVLAIAVNGWWALLLFATWPAGFSLFESLR